MHSSAPTGVAHWMMGLLARTKSKDSPMSVHPSNSLAAPGDGSKTLGCTSALVIHEDTPPHAFHLVASSILAVGRKKPPNDPHDE
ncbi:hypothetical protein VTI28DRAFT_9900 [Corynascus sepedonium]